ncbi:hypothetical protein CONPUDRAFT_160302, partial [Coniophora puteana RWD-64-598 SS2]
SAGPNAPTANPIAANITNPNAASAGPNAPTANPIAANITNPNAASAGPNAPTVNPIAANVANLNIANTIPIPRTLNSLSGQPSYAPQMRFGPHGSARPLPLQQSSVYLSDEQLSRLAERLAPIVAQAFTQAQRSDTIPSPDLSHPQVSTNTASNSTGPGDPTPGEFESVRAYARAKRSLDPAGRQRKPERQKLPNALHVVIRTYLSDKKLWLSKSAHPQSLPQAQEDDIRRYEESVACPPALTDMVFDWTADMRSAGKFKLDPDIATRHLIRDIIQTKIAGVHSSFKEARAAETAAEQAALLSKTQRRRKNDRRNTRRYGTLDRRVKIITYAYAGVPDGTWAEVNKVLKRLGSGGMSDDETDSEGPPKKVRRIRILWLHPDVSTLFRRVEDYAPAIGSELLSTSRPGNHAYQRIFEAIGDDESRPPIKCLPENWYNPDWLRTLSAAAREMLQAQPAVPLPNLVSSIVN